ncbi:Asparagine--tRNA ligase, mitochondrial [Ceratocystis fimbriata CBS 114723]|uniref:asparagine--tRNA ligase n=1 Tax=Ceratocystis fimbriata CBS 114723 TaxID=1035309 RepID=A0A2C5XD14_9PEZI|nr:Asparagine--tRNA ligase, mitochondrial [Ceratocystis fimbriata CBS 114723]
MLRLQLPRRLYSTAIPKKTVAQFLTVGPAESISNARITGWVRSTRKSKTEQFVDVSDGTSLRPLQAVVPRAMGTDIRVGASVRLYGDWVPCATQDMQTHELKVSSLEVIGPSDPKTYPIQKKYQSSEYLRSIPHLRSRIPLNAALLRLRSDAIAAVTRFFNEQNFVQTQPPIITSSDCEGAGEVFTAATGSAADQSKPKNKPADHFFRSPKYLTVSSQLHLEALAHSVGDVWTLSPTFRAEHSDTSRHMSEFYMLEAEQMFVDDMATVMSLLENLLRATVSEITTSTAAKDLRKAVSSLRHQEPELAADADVLQRWAGMGSEAPPWPRITYTEAVELLQKAQAEHGTQLFETPAPQWGEGLASEHEKWLAAHISEREAPGWRTPVFVTHYPQAIKAFYMMPTVATESQPGPASDSRTARQQQQDTVDCFDLLVTDVCEIAGGSMREYRLDNLLATMAERGMALPKDAHGGRSTAGLDWYVDLRRWGTAPHGGFGLGFDRVLSYLSGIPNVKDVVAFPRWYGRCDC